MGSSREQGDCVCVCVYERGEIRTNLFFESDSDEYEQCM